MNCSDCKEFLVMRLEGLAGGSDEQAVREHLEQCETCRAEEETLRDLHSQLISRPARLVKKDLTEDVMSAIVREQHARLRTLNMTSVKRMFRWKHSERTPRAEPSFLKPRVRIGTTRVARRESRSWMSQPWIVKVLGALLISMTTGAFVLIGLGDRPLSFGPFRLSAYYRLTSVDRAIESKASQAPYRWNSIEIYFSGTRNENLQQTGHGMDMNCHFLICNGIGGPNGEIQTSPQWQKQWSIRTGASTPGSDRTIRICLIGDGVDTVPTDYQLKRLEMLLEALCRKFHIPAESVYLPSGMESRP